MESADLVTVLLLVGLEGLLSADNALVMAVMVLGLPKREHQKALSYGLLGAFGFRLIATALAIYLIKIAVVKLLGGLYLLYLTGAHFLQRGTSDSRGKPPAAKPLFGLSPFWGTVIRVELVNLAFSIDSILVAVAMSRKLWVVLSGGILGIVAMRVVVGQLLKLIQKYPALVDGAFVIIGWVAIRLILEYFEQIGVVHFDVPDWLSLGLIGVIFVVSYVYARRQGPQPTDEDAAE